jgi:hypothetical protein
LFHLPSADANCGDGDNENHKCSGKGNAKHDFVSLVNPPQAATDGCDVAEFLVGEFLGFVGRVAGELEVAGGKGKVVGELVGDVGVEVWGWWRR